MIADGCWWLVRDGSFVEVELEVPLYTCSSEYTGDVRTQGSCPAREGALAVLEGVLACSYSRQPSRLHVR